MLTAAELKSVLKAQGLRLTKRLGQHHLVDECALRQIVSSCGLSPEDTVLEIGAGLGALTEELAKSAGRVMAVEVDRRFSALLAERMRHAANVEVRCADILALDAAALRDVVVVGAIPYHITSPILVWLSEHRDRMRAAVLILQQEVARRLTARPGTNAYGRLSLLGHYCWQMELLFAVPRGSFFPPPEVDSACVRLIPRPAPPVAVASEPRLFALVKAAFAQRRKTLVNCLAADRSLGITRREAEAAVEALGLPPAARGETLSLEQFAALANLKMGSDPGTMSRR